MTGGLFDPLGTDRPESSRGRPRPSAPAVVAGLAAAALAVLIAVSYLRDDGGRGRPVAIAPIEHVQTAPKPPPPLPVPPAPAAPPAASPALPGVSSGLPPMRDDQEVEIQNGVRVVRPRRDAPSRAGQTLRVPDVEAPR